jgi:antitoxin ParD1/3/4
MTIQINRPELEALIQQRLHSGAFESVEDVLFDALEMQAEREIWLQENKEAISAKIERGLAQLDRGEGISGDKLRTRLAAIRRLGSLAIPNREAVHRRTGSRKRSPADLARSAWRSGPGSRRQDSGELVDAFAGLAEAPGKGHRRPDLTKQDVLFFTVNQYMIVYHRAATVEIVAILHGKHNVKCLLRTRLPR